MIEEHFTALETAAGQARKAARTLRIWAEHLAVVLENGGRLLTCGNGGSAAEAQYLCAQFTGRVREDRKPYAAIALHADTCALTAILNDYGEHEVFARGVHAHGRSGDVLIALSAKGKSPNVVAAAKTARQIGMTAWALTGPAPNGLASVCHDVVAVETPNIGTIQEIHLAVVHALCGAFEELVTIGGPPWDEALP